MDSTDLIDIKIDIDSITSYINKFRKCVNLDNPIKISVFIPPTYIVGFSSIYKSMLSNDLFSIEISDSLEESAEYLSVDKKLLEDAVGN